MDDQTVMDKALSTPNIEKKPSSLRYYQDGPPDSIDINDWQLVISGQLAQKIQLCFSDIMRLNQITQHRRMVCVCNWSIKRHWSGVLLQDILQLAGIDATRTDNLYLKQTSIGTREKGCYQSTIPLGAALERRALLAHSVDGSKLPIEQGYPMRLIDFGLYGYKSVKGLTQLEITDQYEIGYWEKLAGYELDGTIRKKKYWLVETRKHYFPVQEGEITEL